MKRRALFLILSDQQLNMITPIKCRFSNLLPNPFQQHVNNLKPNVLNEANFFIETVQIIIFIHVNCKIEPIEPLNTKSMLLTYYFRHIHV
ncbi:hypothetical protein D917_02624 [Trichinella nativa]|uniref:Uncharacterized protein n=1 Tax=Trichinella nativa TaxID=6335 RepID=A0A1Y3EIK1_9BILA|nr:hypothetical protein D917_02624 [Trichinella nativa]